jgi:hypothetical protein
MPALITTLAVVGTAEAVVMKVAYLLCGCLLFGLGFNIKVQIIEVVHLELLEDVAMGRHFVLWEGKSLSVEPQDSVFRHDETPIQ